MSNIKDSTKIYTVGVDLGGTNIAVGIVDENMQIVKSGTAKTLAYRPAADVLATWADLVKSTVLECQLTMKNIR